MLKSTIRNYEETELIKRYQQMLTEQKQYTEEFKRQYETKSLEYGNLLKAKDEQFCSFENEKRYISFYFLSFRPIYVFIYLLNQKIK